MTRYWTWEQSLFCKNPKRQQSVALENTVELIPAAEVERVLNGVLEAWANKDESTSLHVWHLRMKAAMAEVKQALGKEAR